MIKDSIQVVALAYNEEDTIGEVLKRTHEVLSRNCERFEVVAFDDGSTDRSSDLCDEFAKSHPHTKVIRNRENRGIRYLLRETYLRASFDWTVIVCSACSSTLMTSRGSSRTSRTTTSSSRRGQSARTGR